MQRAIGTSAPVSTLSPESRAAFIWRTYSHVVLAIALFIGIETWFFSSGMAETILETLISVNWLLVLGAFMVVSWLATRAAHTVESKPLQYLALAALVLAYAVIFVLPLAMAMSIGAQRLDGQNIIQNAAQVTLLGTVGLMAVAHITRKDFSFLRGILLWIGILALVGIVSSVLFGFQLGTWFSVAMIGFAGAAILYDTSNILHHYPEDRHVAAALQLFASIAMMFWYVLQLFMSRD